MECYITYCIKGFLAFSEDFELITQKLFPKESIVTALMEIENKKIVSQEKEIIEEVSKDYDKIIIESNKRISDYSCLKSFDKLEIKTPNAGGEYLRSNLEKFVGDDYLEVYQQLAIAKMKEASKSEDKHLIQAINSIDEIDESISKLIERIREWYALYFPEMDVIKNNETYVRLIAENKTKEKIIEAKPDVFLIDSDYDEEINQSDLDIMNNYANSIYELQKSRKSIENYIEDKMESLAPNLKLLVGASLGAKLISHAGGLKRLATYPSSTVQIMGAEKALFRHLKSGDRPPKYGLIYQHPQIRGAKWWNRGKIARMLASKISLACRKDIFTKDFDPNIYDEFIEKAEQIEMKVYLKDGQIATKNLTPGISVYGEELIHEKEEYRIWNPRRSKLAAALLNGLENLDISEDAKVLYLGASTGTTVSHISDIVTDGRIYAVEFSPTTAKKLVRLARQRTNIAPILGDATKPKNYLNITEKTDIVYCDVAQPTQSQLFMKNMNLIGKDDVIGALMIKARSIDVVQKPKKIFKEEERKLREKGFKIIEKVKLEPYEKDHIAFVVEKNF